MEIIEVGSGKIAEGYFHVIVDAKTYRAEIVSMDAAAKTVSLKINGHNYSVELKDKFDLLLEKMGMNAAAGIRSTTLKLQCLA